MPRPDCLKSYQPTPIQAIAEGLVAPYAAGFSQEVPFHKLPEVLRRLANTPTMRRLLHVNQIGHEPLHHLGPRGHNRFKHSLSAAAVTQYLLENPKSSHSLLKFNPLIFTIAALLHDVGHYATSHSAEKAISGLDHKNRLRQVLEADEALSTIFKEWGIDLEEVIEVITTPFLGNIFNLGEVEFLSADHLSNEFGDTFHAGRTLDPLLLSRLIPLIHVNDQGRLALPKKLELMQAMIQVALAHHQTVFGLRSAVYDTLGEHATRLLHKEGILTLADLEGDDRNVRQAFAHPEAPRIVKEMVYALDQVLPNLRKWPAHLATYVDEVDVSTEGVVYRDGGRPYVLRPTFGDEQEGEPEDSPLGGYIRQIAEMRAGANIVRVDLEEVLACNWGYRVK